LVEAKSLMEHGEWGEWLEKSVEYSKSTANNLMRIFEEYGADQITFLSDNAKSQALGNLSYTQAIALLGVPENEREQFVEEHDLDSMSTRELQQAIKERDQARLELENAKKSENEKDEEARRLQEEKQKAEADKKTSENMLRDTKADLKMLQDALKKERDENKKEVARLEKSIYDFKKQLTEAQKGGSSEEVDQLQESLEEAEKELESSAKRIKELENQLKEAPLEVAATKIPEEVEKELQELRGNTITVKYKVFFNALVENFDNLLNALSEMEVKPW
jgi:chromosome segregation ATPase